jgi:predicted N-acyltransferase
MEIKKLTGEHYEKWDDFCESNNDSWFWHTSKWLEYTLNYRPEAGSQSKSFFVLKDNRIIAICPLIIEKNKDKNEFSFGGDYTPSPVFSDELNIRERERVMKSVFREIDRLAFENKVERIRLRIAAFNNHQGYNQNKYNYLMKFGYLDNSINTQIIDLSKEIKVLRSNIRHGHDADIDRASKILKSEIFDNNNISEEIFNLYSNLHHTAAGRITRPEKTFKMMYEWIKNNLAFLVGAKKNDKFIGFSYFFVYKKNVYYGSACNEPCESSIPIAHFIQWEAIKYMKERGYKWYELGWQPYSDTLSDFPSEKEIQISRFKRGFGGFTIPLFRGEKFFNKDYFLDTYKERIDKYAGGLK